MRIKCKLLNRTKTKKGGYKMLKVPKESTTFLRA